MEITKTKILTSINRKLVHKMHPSDRMKKLFFIDMAKLQVKKSRYRLWMKNGFCGK